MSQEITYPIKITGTIVNAFFICPRKAWLYSREFNPDSEMDLLVLGRLVSEESYKREKKEIAIEGMKIDIVRKEEGEVVVGEIKRSKAGLKAATMQLSYYLWRLKEMGIVLKGELLFPKQRKKIPVELDPNIESELRSSLESLKNILVLEKPPQAIRTRFCRYCAFFDFCFS